MRVYKTARWKDKLPGGLADKSKPSDYRTDQIDKGVEIEMEHTDSKEVAKEIAMDHLDEFGNYYTELEEMEEKLEEEEK